jgi:hypothetical protein
MSQQKVFSTQLLRLFCISLRPVKWLFFRLCHSTPSTPHLDSIEYSFKACRKGDPKTKAVTVSESAVRAIANASDITGLPRDMFDVHQISKAEFEALRSS